MTGVRVRSEVDRSILVRHSDFAPRADDADGAHDPGSHPVLLITKYMLDAGAHIRARRIGGPLRLTEFAIAIGPAMNAALQAARSELFLDLIAAIGAVGTRPKPCCSYQEHLRTFYCR